MRKIDIERPGGDVYLFTDEMSAFNWAVGVAREHGMNTAVYKNPEIDEWVVIPSMAQDNYMNKRFDGWLGRGQVFG